MATIRIRDTDRERIGFMKGMLSIQNFITTLLDKEEQPKEEPKPKRPNPKLKDKPAHPSFAIMKDAYLARWKINNGFEARWNGAIDATALNRLIKSLEAINTSDSPIIELWEVILDKLPQFYKDKTINAINKNLNGIIADIKNGGNKGSKLHQDGGIYDFRK